MKCDHRRPKALNSQNVPSRPLVDNGNYSFSKPGSSFGEAGGNASGRDARRKDVASLWRFAENEGEEEDHAGLGDSRFLDFPIAQGKTDSLERWKQEMSERRRSIEDATEKEDDLILRSDNIERRFEFVESTDDDEDIVEWFRHHKPETEK